VGVSEQAVVILGGAGGIGRAAASRFAAAGAAVIIADADAAGAEASAAEIIAAGGKAIGIRSDVSHYDDVAAAVALACTRHGRLDVLFNCAAIAVHRPLLEHEPEDFERVVRVNQQGTFNGILAAARAMRDLRTPGCIINTASVFAYLASSGTIGYHASKGAVRAMTQAAALELAPLGIRVVAVAPGAVDTHLLQPVRAAGLERDVARRHMRRRIIAPEQVADVVFFLASREADAINGTVVLVDDGYTAFK
jgi:NAD(P)-dependent dehydrogenase (short-subunit alcohol dehydrogenase family)